MSYYEHFISDYEHFITDYDSKRVIRLIYDQPHQLILKNFIIPDGVTIIGTDESIHRFMEAAMPDTSDYLVGAGFYLYKKFQ